MERKQFLYKGLSALGVAFVSPITKACSKADITEQQEMSTDGGCAATPAETAGPFPTKTPSSLVQSNIAGDRSGIPLTVKISITNKNSDCAAFAGAIIDIWHCDAGGNYSEYGGAGMQSTNYTSVHWLRGRQTTNVEGLATFDTIFPGWYSGRAPHIHVHIFSSNGTSLLVTQIAFPTDVCNTVYTTAVPYSARGTQDTQNSRDTVFSDSLARELASVTGSVSNGYTLTHTITVNS